MRPRCLALLLLLSGCTSVQSKIEINAPAKDVRAVLFDFADYLEVESLHHKGGRRGGRG